MMDFDKKARAVAGDLGTCLEHCLPGSGCACVDAIAAALKEAWNSALEEAAEIADGLVIEERGHKRTAQDGGWIAEVVRSKKVPL